MIYVLTIANEKFITTKNSKLYQSAKKSEYAVKITEYKTLFEAIRSNPISIIDDSKEMNTICRDACKSIYKKESIIDKILRLDVSFFCSLACVLSGIAYSLIDHTYAIFIPYFFGLWLMLTIIFYEIRKISKK